MLCIHSCSSVSWPPTLHRLDLCSVMKTTEVFIYVQCNPCIRKLTVNYINKSFQYFYYFFSIFCRFRFCIEEHCWSVFFFKLMYKHMLKLQNKSAHVFLEYISRSGKDVCLIKRHLDTVILINKHLH